MSKQPIHFTKTGTLLAAVWIAAGLAAWSMKLDPDEMGLVLVTVFFFRFASTVAAIGALFGRPIFGAAVGVATMFALIGLEVANVLIAGV